MGASTQLIVALKGTDNTADAFASVNNRVKKFNSESRTTKFDDIMSRLEKMMGRIALLGKATAIYYGASRMAHWLYESLDTMQKIRASAEKIGLETDRYQKLKVVLSQVGILGDELAELVFPKMQRALTDPKVVESLDMLKLDIDAIRKMNPEDQFVELSAAISKLPAESERMRLAFEIFGRQGFRFAPMWRVGPDQFRKGFKDMMDMAPAASNAALSSAEKAFKGIEYVQAAFKNSIYNLLGRGLAFIESKFGDLDTAIAISFEYVHMWGRAFGAFVSDSLVNMGIFEGNFTSMQDSLANMWAGFVAFLGKSLALGFRASYVNAWNSVELAFKSFMEFVKMNWKAQLPGGSYKQAWSDMLTNIGDMSSEAADISKGVWKKMIPDFESMKSGMQEFGLKNLESRFEQFRKDFEDKKKLIVAGMAGKELLMKQTPESSSEMILDAGRRAAGILAQHASFLDAASYDYIKAAYRKFQGSGIKVGDANSTTGYSSGPSINKESGVVDMLSQIKMLIMSIDKNCSTTATVVAKLGAV